MKTVGSLCQWVEKASPRYCIIIKHIMKLDDRGTIEMISENLHVQYFVGLEPFTSEPMMDSSLLVSIRKRVDLSVFEELIGELMREELNLKRVHGQEEKETKASPARWYPRAN